MSEGVFDMPYAIVQADIENSISSKWKALKKEFTKEKKQTVEKNKWQGKPPWLLGIVELFFGFRRTDMPKLSSWN